MSIPFAPDPWTRQRRLLPVRGLKAAPEVERLAKGSRLWRIHSSEWPGNKPNRTVPTARRGGRFDSPTGVPGCVYAADSLEGVVAEVLLRDVPLVDEGLRAVPWHHIAGRRVSVLTTTKMLNLIALHGPAAAAIGQGLWLTKCDSGDYELTRAWGEALRAREPACPGFVWRARHDEDRMGYVLYEPAVPGALAVTHSLPIDEGPGLEAVRRVLMDHKVVIEG